MANIDAGRVQASIMKKKIAATPPIRWWGFIYGDLCSSIIQNTSITTNLQGCVCQGWGPLPLLKTYLRHPALHTDESIWKHGHESDGNQGLFYDAVEMEGDQICNEEAHVEALADTSADKSMQDADATADRFVLVNQDAIDKLKVPELKEELKNHGIKGKRKKSDLKQQLKKAMHDMLPVMAEPSLAANTDGASMKWMSLMADAA
eukprot:350329-Ditylum_brightwellii.AAC.1